MNYSRRYQPVASPLKFEHFKSIPLKTNFQSVNFFSLHFTKFAYFPPTDTIPSNFSSKYPQNPYNLAFRIPTLLLYKCIERDKTLITSFGLASL